MQSRGPYRKEQICQKFAIFLIFVQFSRFPHFLLPWDLCIILPCPGGDQRTDWMKRPPLRLKRRCFDWSIDHGGKVKTLEKWFSSKVEKMWFPGIGQLTLIPGMGQFMLIGQEYKWNS